MFKEVPAQPDFVKQEEKMLEWWEKQNIVDAYLHKNDEAVDVFAFLDGPITANNPMGVHHAHGRTIKDFFQRYKNMQGFRQRFQNGFDCQGLWVEVEEEKDLGFNSKQDIEAYGLDKFSNACRARVERFSGVQAGQSQRLGMFMDWDDSYYTMSERNNLHIWHFLQKVHEKGWLYKGTDAMPWCTRCGTAISQHELSDGGYKDVTHESVYVTFTLTEKAFATLGAKFELGDVTEAAVLIWTTTPWTLLANVAVAVSPEVTYDLVRIEDRVIIVAHDRLNVLDEYDDVLVSCSGAELVAIFIEMHDENVYQGPFDHLTAPQGVVHQIVTWDEVSAEDGSGLVHIAPGAGKEDFELGKERGLGILSPIDDFGNYVEGYDEFAGRNVFDVRADIYHTLKEHGGFYKTASIHHSYPHCWRCKHELVFKTTTEWFIKADEIRPLMKKAAAGVHWMPSFVEKRMQDWLDNMGDWPISRKRYWGLALPFYQNEDQTKFVVVGSKEELRELATDSEAVDKLPELHRPWIDHITLDGTKIEIDGEQQSGIWTRVPDVGDCWLDAGIVPFSTVDYLTNQEYWEEWYPFEFITEYVAQTKLWFYATLFMSVTLMGCAPWKNVLATGFLVDEKGKAMHKSAGNAIAFDEAAAKAGADSIRWLYLRERTANRHGTGNLRFGYNVLDEVRRRYLNILWNTYRYIVTQANTHGWQPTKTYTKSDGVLDQWIIARLHSVVTDATEALDAFDTPTATALFESFVVKDFSQWYIRRSRERLHVSTIGDPDSEAFFQTAYYVLKTLSVVLAPFVPFISEEIFQNIRTDADPRSVHLTNWPNFETQVQDAALLQQMATVREVVEKGHAARKSEGVRVRQPLQKVLLQGVEPLGGALEGIIASELNVKGIAYSEGTEMQVSLDLEMNEALIHEGLVREIIREVQNLRKSIGCQFGDTVMLYWSDAEGEMVSVLDTCAADIAEQTVSQLEYGMPDETNTSSRLETAHGAVTLGVVKEPN